MQGDSSAFSFPVKTVLLGLLCSAVVFVFFLWILMPFVPDQGPVATVLLAAYTATCLTGVFFLAFHALAAVILDPVRRNRR